MRISAAGRQGYSSSADSSSAFGSVPELRLTEARGANPARRTIPFFSKSVSASSENRVQGMASSRAGSMGFLLLIQRRIFTGSCFCCNTQISKIIMEQPNMSFFRFQLHM
ncbi:MAG: hypothetical protein ACTHLW_10330 [Verrucomicrobiota bacterium]